VTNNAVRVFAPAKINLFLHVGEKRSDGYHALQSLVAFTEVGDELLLACADGLVLTISGPFAGSLKAESDNLVLRAACALAEDASVEPRARMELVKNLPVASGIGGGSADAAAALRGLRPLWGLSQPGDDIVWGHWEPFLNRAPSYSVATTIGSDVPVCLLSAPAWMEGRGEQVWSLHDLPKTELVLVNPGLPVSTAEIFRRLDRHTGVAEMIPSGWGHSAQELVAYLQTARNDLEDTACSICPDISEVLKALDRCGSMLSRMSGSGATCFGIFEDARNAANAADALKAEQPHWWVQATKIASRNIGRPRPAFQ
jgi:4-diphosphocytidyl-2-C-methyl-D-erythritol kinase